MNFVLGRMALKFKIFDPDPFSSSSEVAVGTNLGSIPGIVPSKKGACGASAGLIGLFRSCNIR
jgi:hypothetical protein